jgi:predicted phage terminase large subunit-like protein
MPRGRPKKQVPPAIPSPARLELLSRERLLRLAAAKEEWARREARAAHAAPGGLIAFIRYFWKVLEPVTPFVDGWCLEGMCEHLEAVSDGRIKRLLINVPPGFMKSMLLNVFWPAFEWSAKQRPDLRYVAFSYSSILTERDNEKFAYLIASPEYQALYGRQVKVVKEGVGRITNTMRGFKFASSVGGVGTGERGDRILADDLHKVSEAESELVREDTTRWFRESMQNRLNDLGAGAIIVLGQRVHEADVSGVILDEYPDYEHFCVPVEYDGRDFMSDGSKRQTCIGWEDPRTEDGELAWPERYSVDVLSSFRTRPYLWAGQYMQAPSPRGGGIIKRDYWKIWDRAAQAANDVKPGMFPQFEFVLASFDGAYTEKKENDYSALVIIGAWVETSEESRFNEHFGTPRLMLIHAWRKRLTLHGRSVFPLPGEPKSEFEERQKREWGVVEWIAHDCKKFKVDKLIIENKATGHTVEQEMRRLFADQPYSVSLFDPGRLDKTGRAYVVEPRFADGMVWAPGYENGMFVDWAESVVDELAKLPRGAHDDAADATINGIIHLSRMGLAVRKDESHAAFEERMFPSAPPPRRLHYES